jgi:hypothetical protein
VGPEVLVDRDVSELEEMGERFSCGRVARYPARGQTSTRASARCSSWYSRAPASPTAATHAYAYSRSLCELSTLARVTVTDDTKWHGLLQEESSHGDEHVQALADDDGRIPHSRRLIW